MLMCDCGVSMRDSSLSAKGLRWSTDPVDSHQFPRLRLKLRENLVQVDGGMQSLPITDDQVSFQCSIE